MGQWVMELWVVGHKDDPLSAKPRIILVTSSRGCPQQVARVELVEIRERHEKTGSTAHRSRPIRSARGKLNGDVARHVRRPTRATSSHSKLHNMTTRHRSCRCRFITQTTPLGVRWPAQLQPMASPGFGVTEEKKGRQNSTEMKIIRRRAQKWQEICSRSRQGRSDGEGVYRYIYSQNQSTLQIFMWLLVVFLPMTSLC